MSAPTTTQIPGFRGDVIVPDHHDYDDARAIWNGTVDRRPRLIARCSGTADVAAAVRFARDAISRSPFAAAVTTSPVPRCATAGS